MNETHEKSVKVQEKDNRKKDLTAKIMCVVGAVLLWFYVVSSQTIIDERRFASIPVEIMSTEIIENEYGMTVISGYNYTVDVTVSGVKNELNRLSAEDISAYVDLSKINAAGEYTLDVRTSVPGGVTIKELSSNYVNVYVDKRSSKPVEVRVNPIYSIESEYSIGTPSANLTNVTVTGPEDVLDNVAYAQATVDVGRLTGTVTATGSLVLIGKDGAVISNPYVKLHTTDVIVKIPVYTEKEIPLSVGFKHGFYNEKNSEIKIEPQSIVVRGEPAELARLGNIEVMTIDEKKMAGVTGSRVAVIELPDGIENVNRVESVTVTVTHINTLTRDIYVDNVEIKNPEGLDYSVKQDGINLTLRGSSGSLALISADNVTLTADLSYYSKGTGKVTVPVNVSIPAGLSGSVYELGEYSLEIEIK